MNDMMQFPTTVEEFMEKYKIIDTEQVYTNGAELVPIFRMKQWFDHIEEVNKTNDDTISRQAAIDALVKWTNLTWEHLKTIYPMLNVFEKLPSAERHGHWEFIGGYGYQYRCSVCVTCAERKTKFCSNCGAKMDEVNRMDNLISKKVTTNQGLSPIVQEIIDYLNTEVHPIVSPEYWDVYSTLYDMVVRIDDKIFSSAEGLDECENKKDTFFQGWAWNNSNITKYAECKTNLYTETKLRFVLDECIEDEELIEKILTALDGDKE